MTKMLTRLAFLVIILGMVVYGQGTAFAATLPKRELHCAYRNPSPILNITVQRNQEKSH